MQYQNLRWKNTHKHIIIVTMVISFKIHQLRNASKNDVVFRKDIVITTHAPVGIF